MLKIQTIEDKNRGWANTFESHWEKYDVFGKSFRLMVLKQTPVNAFATPPTLETSNKQIMIKNEDVKLLDVLVCSNS